MAEFWEDIASQFEGAFITKDRWSLILEGVGNTMVITFFALIIGMTLGVMIAMARSTWDRTSKNIARGPLKTIFWFVNGICKVYITVIRGTPVMIQLMIIFFIILTTTNKMIVAIIAFGINSAAYIAEIMRSGIMSIDQGQIEAGRSLGFNYIQTMWYIVLPQAFKNILPALGNESIGLFKETAIAGTVGVTDLTRASNMIRGITFQSFFPLLTAALIYLLFVLLFTWLVGKLERRLRSSER